MARVLVTGAEGFIGSHLVEALVSQGKEVKAFVHYNADADIGWLSDTEPKCGKDYEVFFGDLRDADSVSQATKGCAAVINLAALISIQYSYVAPKSYMETNLLGLLNVLQAVRNFDVEMLLHTSTSEVYGSPKYIPIDEGHPLQGQSPYSASKIAADQLAYSFFTSFGTPVKIIRPFNTFGPRQSPRAVIPAIIKQLIMRTGEVRLGNLDARRSFNYVDDTVNAFIKALDSNKGFGEPINFGNEFHISIGDLASKICELFGVQRKIVQETRRVRPSKSEVNVLSANSNKALSLLSWEPEYSGEEGLSAGLQRTIDWFKSNPSAFSLDKNHYHL